MPRGLAGAYSIPAGITSIAEYALFNCTGLTSITIPHAVTEIGKYAFSGCTGLNSVSIPATITLIPVGAFEGCTSLTGVSIPSSVTSIDSGAFAECTSLTGMFIPASVKNIGDYAFLGCVNLSNLSVDSANPNYASLHGALFDKKLKVLFRVPANLTGAYAVPAGVTTIIRAAFFDSKSLTSIAIPASVNDFSLEYIDRINLNEILVDPNNATYASVGGVLFDKSLSVVLLVPNGLSGAYSIPPSVSGISAGAFSGCKNLLSIFIPPSVTYISDGAFSGASGLANINIPSGVNYIGRGAFDDCSSLMEITVDQANAFYASAGGILFDKTFNILIRAPGAFSGTYTIPSTVTFIADEAFAGCASLTSVSIPGNVTVIGSRAFEGCSGLTSVSIPNSVDRIESYTFAGCSSLSSISIPASVTQIGWEAFLECSSLAGFTVDSANPFYASSGGVLFDKSLRTLIYAPGGLSGTYSIPSTVTRIAYRAFANCSSLSTVSIPPSVTTIESLAFADCANLVGATFTGHAPIMGERVFYGSSPDFSIRYPSWASGFITPRWQGYPTQSFEDGRSAQTITFASLPNRVWGEAPFTVSATSDSGLPVTLSVVSGPAIVSGLTVTLTGTGIGTVTLRAEQAGDATYRSATPVEQTFTVTSDFTYTTGGGAATITGYTGGGGAITLPATINGLPVTAIGDNAFYNHDTLTSITFPAGLTHIGYGAFNDCDGLTSVNLPAGLTSIGEWAFNSCGSLASVGFPSSLTTIGQYAFYYCTALNGVVLPEGLTAIGASAFSHCTSLSAITIPASVASLGSEAFAACSALAGITVATANPAYASLGGVLFNKALSTLIQAPGGLSGAYVVPTSVTTIGASAFHSCSQLTGVTLPAGVTTIGGSAFASCYGLTGINLPTGLTSLGTYAFYGCSALTTIQIPASVSSIGSGAFDYCSNLSAINVDSANGTYASSAGVLFDKAFQTLLRAPGALSGTYTVPVGVLAIGDDAFAYCYGLTGVRIPASVTSIGQRAFINAVNLASVDLAEGLLTIGSYAFYGCGSLTAITLPESLLSVDNYAFRYCSKLVNATFLGNAPTMDGTAFANVAAGFTLHYRQSATGFSSPTWNGYATQAHAKVPQFIILPELANHHVGDEPFAVAATSSSGLPVTISVVSGPATITGGTVTLTGSGIVTLRAEQAGNATYAAAAVEHSFTVFGDYIYEVFNGTALITGYNGGGGAITIPSVIDGLPVAGIREWTFNNRTDLTSVSIPASVTYIGLGVFANCSALTAITVDAANADYASAGGVLFDKNYVLLIQAPGALSGHYTVPASVATIGIYAFEGCRALTGVTIHASVTKIENFAFILCRNLIAFEVDASNPFYADTDGVLFSKDGTTLIQAPGAFTGVYTVPPSTTRIGAAAFADTSGLTAVVLPEGVEEIGEWAFLNCAGLSSAIIPASVTSIGHRAFMNCADLSLVTFAGHAPVAMEQAVFFGTAEDFHITYPAWAWGFTTPTWSGYPAAPYEDGRVSQTITFTAVDDRMLTDGPLVVSPLSTSGLSVTLRVLSGPATISGYTITPTGTGVVTLRAEQTGNASYAPALAVLRTFRVELPLTEALDLDAPTPVTTGHKGWFGQSSVSQDGVDAAQSGQITDNQASHLTLHVSGLSGISFYWKISSEAGWDYLRFFIDGVEQTQITGEVDWQPKAFPLSSGAHTLTWSYTKDDIYSSGSDAGWVDDVVLVPADSFSTWLAAAGLSGENATPMADPDADGIANLLEYALDLDPLLTSTSGLPMVTRSGNQLTLTYRRVRAELAYTVETSTNLSTGTWTSVGVNQGTPAADGSVTASIPLSGPRTFLRLNVTRP